MSRKDIILIAALINAGLLALLFITATVYDTDTVAEDLEIQAQAESPAPPPARNELEIQLLPTIADSSGDEVDNILKQYTSRPTLLVAPEHPVDITGKDVTAAPSDLPGINPNFVTVTVKRGDSLEKIARANGSTISAIKKANSLESERLSIGQVLKIPLNKEKGGESKTVENEEPQYYTVKSGDSPWKIAKQFNVKYEEILKLNHLNEEKARNLKVGDRIRVK